MIVAVDLVAVGTLVSAVATLVVAYVTWRLVRVTQQIAQGGADELAATKELAAAASAEAAVTSAALALQVEPRIVPVDRPPRFELPDNIGGSWSTHWVARMAIEIENVGIGMAEVVLATVQVTDWSKPENVLKPGVLRSGNSGLIRAEFTMPTQEDAAGLHVRPGQDVNVRVHYRGGGGRDYQVAFIWQRHAGDTSRWTVGIYDKVGHLELPPVTSQTAPPVG